MADLPKTGTPAQTAAAGNQPTDDPYAWLNFSPGTDWIHESQAFLARLNLVGRAAGQHIDVFSGFRSSEYSDAVGGYANDPHSRGVAVDANVGGRPVGQVIDQGSFARYGLESGNQPKFYQGGPDPAHVQVLGSGVDKSITAGTFTGQTAAGGADGASEVTPEGFWGMVLDQLGFTNLTAEQRKADIGFLASWASAEGTSARWNPLATTLPLGGSTALSGNPAGVQEYTTPEYGAQATAQTIKAGYPSITALLRSGDPGALVRLGRPGVESDLRKWVLGHRTPKNPEEAATASQYVSNVKIAFQGGKGNLSAADWASYDLGSAASDVAGAAGKVLGPLQTIYHALAWLVENPGRVALILAGTGLTAIGVVMLAKASAAPAGNPVRDFSQSAGTVAGVAKVVR